MIGSIEGILICGREFLTYLEYGEIFLFCRIWVICLGVCYNNVEYEFQKRSATYVLRRLMNSNELITRVAVMNSDKEMN